MKKHLCIRLRELAKKLPQTQYVAVDRVKISGEDLLLSGTKKVDGNDVDKEMEYLINCPIYYESNHFLRLKKAYSKQGVSGVLHYTSQFIKPESRADFSNVITKYLS